MRFLALTLSLLLSSLASASTPATGSSTKTIAPSASALIAHLGSYTVAKLPSTSLAIAQWASSTEFFAPEAFVPRTGAAQPWTFRWKPSATGVTQAVVQVSIFPLEPTVASYESSSGIVAQKLVTAVPDPGKSGTFTFDFNTIDPFKKPATPAPGTSTGIVYKPWDMTSPLLVVETIKLPKLDPVWVYVRIVPLDKDGLPAALPSKSVKAVFGKEKPVTPATVTPLPTLTVTASGFDAGRPDNWNADRCFVFLADLPWVANKGDHKCFFPSSGGGSFLDKLGDAITGFVGFAKDLVDYIASAYSAVKKAAIDIAAGAVAGLTGCGDICRIAISAAVDYGLAAMGLPPEIPNFDELMAHGQDYLVSYAVESAIGSGVPADVAKEAANKAVTAVVDEVKKAANTPMDGAFPARPDPDYQYSPAVLYVTAKNATGASLPATELLLTDPSGLYKPHAPIYVPATKAGQSLTIPVYLTPTDDPHGWKTAGVLAVLSAKIPWPSADALKAWMLKYLCGSRTFNVAIAQAGLDGYGAGLGMTSTATLTASAAGPYCVLAELF